MHVYRSYACTSERSARILFQGSRELSDIAPEATKLINARSESRIKRLLEDGQSKGAKVSRSTSNAAVIEGVTTEMEFWRTESFGALVGLHAFDEESELLN